VKPRLSNALLLPCLALAVLAGLFGSLRVVAAQGPSNEPIDCRVDGFEDNDQDGIPSRAFLECDLAQRGVRNDAVTIIDRDGDLREGDTWPDIADVEDDVWIFDYDSDDSVDMILEFRSSAAGLVANLYARQDDVPSLRYSVANNTLRVTNMTGPVLQVTAPDGWWMRDSQVNLNLDIEVDGYTEAVFQASLLSEVVDNNGNADFRIIVRDTDYDGRAEYDWRTVLISEQALNSTPSSLRTFLTVNEADNGVLLSPVFPWPYLGGVSYGYDTTSYRLADDPPIQMDWEAAQVIAIGEFVQSRGNETQWFVYSPGELEEGVLNKPAFESPFVWYDLANDNDRRAELAIRVGYFAPRNWQLLEPRALKFIRYAWDQDNDNFWDYKLGLLGLNEVESLVSIPELNLDMDILSYEDAPQWVLDQSWGVATFVAAENTFASGEGIYEWDVIPDYGARYFAGNELRPTHLDEYHSVIEAGYRGEYQSRLEDTVELYMSAIDNKLHLVNIEWGIWNIDDRSAIYYDDMNQDGYVDHWHAIKETQPHSDLWYAAGVVVYMEDDEAIIKQMTEPAVAFHTAPPRTHQQWQELGTKIAAYEDEDTDEQDASALVDLRAVFNRIEGSDINLWGVSLSGFRATEQGFRVIVDVAPDYRMNNDLDPAFDDLEPGEQVLTYNEDEETFTIEPVQPATIEMVFHFPDTRTPTLGSPHTIAIEAMNEGGNDAVDLMFVAEATNGIHSMQIMTQTVDVLQGSPTWLSLQWQPITVDDWEIVARLYDPETEEVVASNSRMFTISETERRDVVMYVLNYTMGNGQHLVAGFVLLIGAVTLSMVTEHLLRLGRKQSFWYDLTGSVRRSPPWLFFPVNRLHKFLRGKRGKRGTRLVKQDTELVIEGFFRSGNTFAVRAFEEAQPNPVRLADHSHATATIIRAVRWNIPTVLLIRNPRDTISSAVLKLAPISTIQVLKEYIRFHTIIFPYIAPCLLVRFEDVTTDMGQVIQRINQRFGTDFVPFVHEEAQVQSVLNWIETVDRMVSSDVGRLSIPSAEKHQLKMVVIDELESAELDPLMEQAETIYQQFLDCYHQQRD
jgi:hypothetical protein